MINECYHPPAPVGITWSDKCFREPRILSEMLRFSVSQGATSLRTLNEQIGLDPDLERERKAEEGKAPEAEVLPRLDKSGRLQPGGGGPVTDPKNKNGRPAGTPDPRQG